MGCSHLPVPDAVAVVVLQAQGRVLPETTQGFLSSNHTIFLEAQGLLLKISWVTLETKWTKSVLGEMIEDAMTAAWSLLLWEKMKVILLLFFSILTGTGNRNIANLKISLGSHTTTSCEWIRTRKWRIFEISLYNKWMNVYRRDFWTWNHKNKLPGSRYYGATKHLRCTNQPASVQEKKTSYYINIIHSFWRESEVSLDILCWKNMNMDGHELKSKVYY